MQTVCEYITWISEWYQKFWFDLSYFYDFIMQSNRIGVRAKLSTLQLKHVLLQVQYICD